MISAQFRIQLPESLWIASLSQEFRDVTFRLLSGYRTGETALELGEVVGDNPMPVVEAMREHSSIATYELLESADRRALGKYETTDTALYDFVEASDLTIEFPVVVQDGWYEFDLTGTRDELDRLQAVLDATPLRYELLSVIQATNPEDLLTTRQQEVIELAIREGYYEIPRRSTLSELAEQLDRDKSTVSTILRRGEAQVITAFMHGPEQGL